MGSCISKCKPKKKSKEEDVVVQDKVAISRDPPPTEITIMPSHKPLSPISSTASFSSFSCSAAATAASSVSSSSSSSYSTNCVSKDRSFSNEFLRSCAKENPHAIAGLNVQKTAPLFPNEIPSRNLPPSPAPAVKKRARAASPTLVRQKSFRKEPNRGIRSPSPSRRFNGDGNRIFPFRESGYNGKPAGSGGCNAAPKRESFRGAVPRRESFRAPKAELSTSRVYSSVRKIDGFREHISSKIEGKEIDVVMEDIDNPHIALDCFIFL
ncbi:hypothetical protein SASPL_104154 [Salvia splendens]|uniref:Uncharacterized protein n=1 Tax=Salvia splendens TaxID=180675 RepID=A0A8X8YIR1_SALSN|nr:uncharacterized protein LOC121770350 [Salvia splendens]KAG6432574.1 hypothetical protein SASPL_104154 [Salvia splendens]